MAVVEYFTVTGNFQAALGATVSEGTDLVAISGVATFAPSLKAGDALLAAGLTTPTMVTIPQTTATIDTGGELTYGGQAGVRLPANTAVLGLAGDLFYTVTFTQMTANGQPVTIAPFSFTAPTSDTPIDLTTVTHIPTPTYPGLAVALVPDHVRWVDNQLVWSANGVDIPDPLTVDISATNSAGITDATATGRAVLTGDADAGRAALDAAQISLLDARRYGVIGNGTHDDTPHLQAWLNDLVADHKQGWLPNGTYKTTDTLTIPYGYGWAVHGENPSYTIISQATDNIPVVQISETDHASHSYALNNLTLTYASPQPSTNTDANNILFEGAAVGDGASSSYIAQFRNLNFANGFYAMKTVTGLFAPWACEFDNLNMGSMSGGFWDTTGCQQAPNNRWGRISLNCDGAAGPIFKDWYDTSTSVACLEFMRVTGGATLIQAHGGFSADIGTIKMENGHYSGTAKPLIDFPSTHNVRIGQLLVYGNDMTFTDGFTIIRAGYGTGRDDTLLEIGSLSLDATSVTGTVFAVNAALNAPNRRTSIGQVYFGDDGFALQNSATDTGDYLTVQSWVNGTLANVGDEDYTIVPGCPNILRFTTTFTTGRTITLPHPYSNNVFNGLWYELIFDGCFGSAATINAADGWLRSQNVDKVKLRYVYHRFEWVLTDIINIGAPATGYSVSNVSTDRAYDANSTTTDELADVLGTLIADLIAKGIISA